MPPVEIKKHIHWVGAVDWNIREFHGYSTYKGTTYNAFLMLDDKKVLFDTVKKGFCRDLDNIRALVDPAQIDYFVVNHAEMDHTGCLPEIVDLVRPEKIFCSGPCKKALIDHFHREDWPYEEVTSGTVVSTGKKTMTFLETRMLHWPDSMFTYIKEDGLLISSDAFGQHWATGERFDDEVDQSELMAHGAKYYANILLPYSGLVQKLLATVKDLKLDISMIATDHGLIWRRDPGRIITAYDDWSLQKGTRKAVIIYDTMWGSTEQMAQAVADGLIGQGVHTKFMDLKANHRSEVITEVLNADAVMIGSPTLNNDMLPTVQDMLCYMRGLKPRSKVAGAFGSYGWSGEAADRIKEILDGLKWNVIESPLKCRYVPRREVLDQCREMGKKAAEAVNLLHSDRVGC